MTKWIRQRLHSPAEWLAEAQRHVETRDYGNALPLFRKAGDAGDMTAMNHLGVLYRDGKGVDQDYAKALEWFQKAADAGDATAMSNLGVLYRNGKGVAKDDAKAHGWFQKAARQISWRRALELFQKWT
jgi:TPR repeat protein